MILFLTLLLLLMSLVIHELGHWALLTRYGVATSEYWLGTGYRLLKIRKLCIGLFPIGAGIHPSEAGFNALTARQRTAVALAGPAASTLYSVALSFAAYSFGHAQARESLLLLAHLNVLIALFNLLPVPPLDGWVAFTSLAEHLGHPLSPKWAGFAKRLGNGIIYGLGFFVLWGLVVKGVVAL